MINGVLSRLLEEIKKQNSWGKNQLIELLARVQAEVIEEGSRVSVVVRDPDDKERMDRLAKQAAKYLAEREKPNNRNASGLTGNELDNLGDIPW